MAPLQLAVIIGSTREGRMGDRVGRWFVDQARQHDQVTVTVVDLADYDFPASYPAEPTAPMRSFAARIGQAEAFVVVTPEYNHSFPASVKQAIDYAYDEWQAKPVGFVSYGCGSVGLHAVDQLRTVFTALHAVTMRDVVGVDLLCDEPMLATDELGRTAGVLLDQLCWWGLALRDGRARRPYVS
ncbi:NADPH-dependent FMN reductase [Micromonospora deserti]|uniref:NADPH-dependent FMN reductase n=1 Tax=Micromonospora deserti TaxID=2070366 RepID=A0A2W2CSJ2_9ACTN|nr:NAD(P)H-dependent oxidoreductase [Micromonospora deserti]PZG00841.1 NADPH-dependent FMN reductase [Micromonospora deserti]